MIDICLQFLETSDDGARDWGAHVREDDAPLDKVNISSLLHSLCCSTVLSGKVQSPQHHRGENRRVHQHRGGNEED